VGAAPEVAPEVGKMLTVIQGEMSRVEIQQKLGLADEKHIRDHYQKPTVAMELNEMTTPDKPRSSRQKYRLTNAGKHLLKST
jgi:ATP-dependent DNA helicase RecG